MRRLKPRVIVGLVATALLSACASGAELGNERAELGNFLLGYAVVDADGARVGPGSRSAEPEKWEASLTAELERRFGRYQGERLYHIGVGVQGYVLAIPGIPVVASPKSFLIVAVNVWDDAAETRLTEEPKRIIVFESLSGETAIGSGLTQSAEQQMQNLSQNAVGAIERWLAKQEGWFPPAQADAVPDPAAAAQESAPADQPVGSEDPAPAAPEAPSDSADRA